MQLNKYLTAACDTFVGLGSSMGQILTAVNQNSPLGKGALPAGELSARARDGSQCHVQWHHSANIQANGPWELRLVNAGGTHVNSWGKSWLNRTFFNPRSCTEGGNGTPGPPRTARSSTLK